MATNDPGMEKGTPQVSPGNYSPVTVYVKDTVGAVFLGILSVILLIGWRRTEKRYRTLIAQQETTHGNHSIDSG